MSSRINRIEQRVAELERLVELQAQAISELEFKQQRKRRSDAGRKRNTEHSQSAQG